MSLKFLNLDTSLYTILYTTLYLGHLCMFATGRPQIGEITVEFHSEKFKKMPKAATCPRVLTLPVCHHTYDDFKKQMDNALFFESEGFHVV